MWRETSECVNSAELLSEFTQSSTEQRYQTVTTEEQSDMGHPNAITLALRLNTYSWKKVDSLLARSMGAHPHQHPCGQKFDGNETFREAVTAMCVGLSVFTNDLSSL